ncbi:hypothetical protein ACIBH1_44645 [Nonomuraea sp. NPDC050663]|uniref:DUF6197 family protein n=1 Tax=Nonomuraea sp. NPDC050663 TaxID=3364370 RepID=UPI0037A68791
MPPSTPGAVLRRAVQILAVNGRHVGNWYDIDQHASGIPAERCGLCMLGALNVAVGLRPDTPLADHPVIRARRLVYRAALLLAAALGESPDPRSLLQVLSDWHDGVMAPVPPADESVTALMLQAADADQALADDTH